MQRRWTRSPWLLEVDPMDDPFDAGKLIRLAVDDWKERTGNPLAEVARRSGLTSSTIGRSAKNPDAAASTVRAVCRALGLRVVLVPAEAEAPPLPDGLSDAEARVYLRGVMAERERLGLAGLAS